jgi:hypothetical protein
MGLKRDIGTPALLKGGQGQGEIISKIRDVIFG